LPGPDDLKRYNPDDLEPYLTEVAPKTEHEVNFEGNGHDPEAARSLLGLLRDRLSPRILNAIEGGPEAFEPEEGKDGSTSGADDAVCTVLIGVGLTDNQIRNIYSAYPIGTREKYARRGNDYLAGTLKNEREWVDANGKSKATNDDAWEEPVPLPEGLPPVAALDPAMVPEPLRGWLGDVSERMQIPLDFAATGAVVVAGSLIGRKIGIYPKRYDDWLVGPNLWGALHS